MREIGRTTHAKTFADGTKRSLQASVAPIHHWKNGALLDFDLTPQERAGDHLMNGAPFAVTVDKAKPAYSYVSEDGTGARVEFLGLRPGAPVVSGSSFLWANPALDTDVRFTVGPNGITADVVLKSTDAPAVEYSVEDLGKLLNSPVARDAKRRRVELDIVRTPATGGYAERITLTGRVVNQRNRATRQPVWGTDIEWPVTLDPSISQNISDNADDGSTYNGTWYEDGYLGLVNTGVYDGNEEHGAVRWRALAIGNVTIDDADITVEVVDHGGSPDLDIYVDDVDDAALWSSSSKPEDITQSTAKTDWLPSGTGTEVIDVTAQVQEILDRGGWSSGNDMRFAFLNQHALSGTHTAGWDDLSGGGSPSQRGRLSRTTPGPTGRLN